MTIDTNAAIPAHRPLTEEEISRYAGQWIAWGADGTAVAAAGASVRAVRSQLETKGIDPASVVLAFVPFPDEAVVL